MKLSRAWRKVPRKRLSQYFGQWAIESQTLSALVAGVGRIDATKHLAFDDDGAAGIDAPEASLASDGVVTLCIRGAVTKYGSSLSDAGSTSRMRRMVRQWTDDERVRGLFLVIDSPGGTVAGTGDLAEAIAAFAAAKPCVAYCEDLCASAAYWIASQAREVYANATALVGSIGAFACLVDSSKAHAAAGLEVHVIRSAPGKGRGSEGMTIDEATLADMQRIVDFAHEQFVDAVAAGRGVDGAQVQEEWADGTCYPADEAESLGLIDGTMTLEEARGRVLGSAAADAASQISGSSTMPKKFSRAAAAKPKPAAKVRRGKLAASTRRRTRAEDPPADQAEDEEMAEGEEQPEAEDDEMCEGEEEPAAEGEEDPAAEGEEEPTAEDEEMADDEEPPPAARRGKASARRRPMVATIAQLKAACPRSDAAFRERCIEAGCTIAQAKDRYIRSLEAKVDSAPSQVGRTRGVQPLGSQRPAAGASFRGDPRAAWEEAVAKKVAAGMDHTKARAAVARERPELREAMVAAANQ